MTFSQHEMMMIATAGSVLTGIIFCFWGYRIFKVVLGIWGFVVGGMTTVTGVLELTHGNQVFAWVSGLFAGIGCAILFIFFYYLGIFLLGAGFGGLVGRMFFPGMPLQILIIIGLAVIFGTLALVFQKLIIIISTSFVGAWGMVAGVVYFFGINLYIQRFFMDPVFLQSFGQRYYMMLIVWVIIAVSGVIVQYRRPDEAEREKSR